MSGTIKKKCSCKNDYQDKLYGKNIRIKNICGKSKEKCRCTGCGIESHQ